MDNLPPFFRDFHDQKDFVRAFYVWMGMLDSKANSDGRSEFFEIHRPQMCSWVDFTILMATLLDFLAQHGWVLRRARGSIAGGNRDKPDVSESVKSLNDLEKAWYALVDPDDGPRLRDDLIDLYMKGWEPWLEYMPSDVQSAWNARKLEPPLRPTPTPPVIARSDLGDEAISTAHTQARYAGAIEDQSDFDDNPSTCAVCGEELDRVDCDRCGGEGFVEYLDAPDTWGEDCPSEENHLVTCPDCRGSGGHLECPNVDRHPATTDEVTHEN